MFCFFIHAALDKLVQVVSDDVHALSGEKLAEVAQSLLPELKLILTGQKKCHRHDLYKQGKNVVKMYNLDHGVTIFSDDMHDAFSQVTLKIFPDEKYCFDYIMDVLTPELSTMMLEKILSVERPVADVIMCGCLKRKDIPFHISIPYGKSF